MRALACRRYPKRLWWGTLGEDGDNKYAGSYECGDGQEVENPFPPSIRCHKSAHQNCNRDLARRNGHDTKCLRYPVEQSGLLELCRAQVHDMTSAAFGCVKREEYRIGYCEPLNSRVRWF